jgi:hypothetical protein
MVAEAGVWLSPAGWAGRLAGSGYLRLYLPGLREHIPGKAQPSGP